MFSAVLLLLTTVLVLVVPGVAVGWSLGLRPWTTVAVAPALTLGLVAAAGAAASVVGFHWDPVLFGLGTLAVCAAVVLARWLWRRRAAAVNRRLFAPLPRPSLADATIAGGVVLGWLISGTALFRGFGSMGNPNQNWDYVFHANAVRLIADTGNVAPSGLGSLTDWEAKTSFYPNAFHGLGALVRDLTGAPVFDVLNAQTMTISGVAGLGLAGLLRAIGAPTVVSATTPILLAGFASFPYDILRFGPLLPYAMAVALLPAFFVLLNESLATRRCAAGLANGLAAAALLGVQTSIALSAALVTLPLLVQRWVAATRAVRRDLLTLVGVGLSALILAFPYALGAVSASGSSTLIDWPAIESVGQAVGDLLMLNHDAPAPQYWLAGLLVVGLLTVRRARYMWWWLAGGAIAFAQFVLAASSDTPLAEALTSFWWNDRYRFAALTVLAFAPLAAAGLHILASAAHRAVRVVLRGQGWRRYGPPIAAVAVLLSVVVLSNGLYVPSNGDRLVDTYQAEWQISRTEVDAMRWLSDQPDATGMIMNDPNDGSPLMLATTGLQPVYGHVRAPGTTSGKIERLLLDHFNCLDSSSAIRSAVQRLGIRYVFTSDGYVLAGYSRAEGLRGLAALDSLQRVYAHGSVRIYRVSLTSDPSAPSSACARVDSRFSSTGG